MTKINKHVSVIGLGNISFSLCESLKNLGCEISGVTDNLERYQKINKIGVKVYNKKNILKSIEQADSIIITAPPDDKGCPILRKYKLNILKSNISWIGYLSSTSVYGNHNGRIVFEDSKLIPKNNVEVFRYKAEQDVLKFGLKSSILTEIFRLSGIYGYENNILKQILSNNFKPILKKNHFFNRIHIDDIVRVISLASFSGKNSGIINLSDDLPTSQIDLAKYAYNLLDMKMPKIRNYDEIKNQLNPSLKRFWENNRRVSNKLLKKKYGSLIYPTYKEGLKNIYNIIN